jgi:uncharacterized cupin superfamily protein
MNGEVLIRRAETADCIQESEHPGYEFIKRVIVGKGDSEHFEVSVYEVPPGKAAVPYHYHLRNEEVFFILSGTGLLKSPEGERTVTAGDFLYFPNNEKGAHKITNVSENEPLIYADFDIMHDLEVAFYPDSDKVGIFGMGNRLIFPVSKKVDYYEGE